MGLPSDLCFLHATNSSGNHGRRKICKKTILQSWQTYRHTSCNHCLMVRLILRLNGRDRSRSCQDISVPLASGGQNGHLISGVVGRLRLYRASPRPLRLTTDARYMTIRIECSVFAVRRCMRQKCRHQSHQNSAHRSLSCKKGDREILQDIQFVAAIARLAKMVCASAKGRKD